MTPEEAIKTIELAKAEVEWDYPVDYTVAFEMAKEALEKQIPKKPLNICTPVLTWGICPVCKGELNKLGNRPNRVFENQAYCMDCGQKLDWRDSK